MAKKKLQDNRLKERHLEKYKKKKPGKKKTQVKVGRQYRLDEIESMLGNIRSEEREKSATASIQFLSDNKQISETLANIPNQDIDSILSEVSAVVARDSELILTILEETKKITALTFLAKSEKMPPAINQKAQTVLKRMHLAKDAQKFEKQKEAATDVKAFTPTMVKTLWKNLNSTEPQTRISAAITLFTHYSKIAQTMPKVPMLTISQLMVKAKDVTFRNTDPLFRQVLKTWNRAAVGYMATSESLPPRIRKRAQDALNAMQPTKTIKPKIPGFITPKPKTPELKTKTLESPVIQSTQLQAKPEKKTLILEGEEIKTAKAEVVPVKFDEKMVKQIWKNLNSKEINTTIQAAIKVFSNYHDISRVLPSIPMLTISQVVTKASETASQNMVLFFKKVSDTRNVKALQFLSISQAVPPELSKKAIEILEYFAPKKKREKKDEEPKVTFKEGTEDDEDS
jgi:hypothetical protein